MIDSQREARYQKILFLQPEFETLDGIEILRSSGSDFAAFPASGKRNSRVWQIFNIKTREPITQLRKNEVVSWLVKIAMTDK